MNALQNLVEYYEELFPIEENQKHFFTELFSAYTGPIHFLGVSCGTGNLEHYLAKQGIDVTGIDIEKEFIEYANRKRRTQLMSLRYFQMSGLEMSKYLQKGFFNVISSLNNKLIFIYDKLLIQKFLAACKSLLVQNGTLVLQIPNFDFYNGYSEFSFPERESIRSRMYIDIHVNERDEAFLTEVIETGNERILPVFKDKRIYPLMPAELRQIAREAGFTKLDLYADYNFSPVTEETEELICVLS